jgi:hypothetical protein
MFGTDCLVQQIFTDFLLTGKTDTLFVTRDIYRRFAQSLLGSWVNFNFLAKGILTKR